MKQYNIIALLVFLGALAWIFFLAPESTAGLRSNFLSWFSPVVKAAGAVQGEADPADSRSREELLAEVEKLEEAVINLSFTQRNYLDLEKENTRLRADLEFKRSKHYNLTIPAQVIKRNRTSWWSTVTINRGTQHQVTKDLPVINRNHAVVGKVIPNGLTKTTAEVLLLTDEQCKVAARVGQNVSMRGIVNGHRGLGNLTPEIRLNFLDPYIPPIPAGAMLFTDAGEGRVFPPNLFIGRVLRQIKGDTSNSAVIEPKVDFAKLDSVFVIRTTDDEEEADAVGPTVEETASITP
jgi:rod shape-determining protein MreC